MVIIFDCGDGEMIYSRRTETPCTSCGFAETDDPTKVIFFTLFESGCVINDMVFDLSSMSYVVKSHHIGKPTVIRNVINTLAIGTFLFVTSTTGDVELFDLREKAFKGCLDLKGQSIVYLAATPSPTSILISTGSNSVHLVDVSDLKRLIVTKTLIDKNSDRIIGLSSNYQGDVLISLSNGRVKKARIDIDEEIKTLPVQFLTSHPRILEMIDHTTLACACDSGEVVFWDTSTWSRKSNTSCKASPITAMTVTDCGILIVGHEDGCIFCFTIGTNETTLHIPIGHRGAVTGLSAFGDHFASVGADGILRLWKLRGKVVPVTEFSTAPSMLGAVIIGPITGDENVYVYTSMREVIQFNLKRNKIAKKMTTLGSAGNIVGMTSSSLLCANGQDRDFVIVTAHHDGKFIVWDFDYDAPLKIFSLPHPEKLRCIYSSLQTHGEIYGGTESGGIVRFSLDDAQSSMCTVASNQVSNKPAVCITTDGNGQILILNSEGLVFLASLK